MVVVVAVVVAVAAVHGLDIDRVVGVISKCTREGHTRSRGKQLGCDQSKGLDT